MKPLLLVFGWLVLSSCAEHHLERQVCQDPAEVLQLGANSQFSRRGDGRLIIYETFQQTPANGLKTNTYCLELRPQGDTLRCCRLEYPPVRALTRPYAARTVKALYQRLDSLGIRSYGAETANSGVLLTLYTNGGGIIFHARDTAHIASAQTRAYIRQATPLCPNWYRSEY